MADKTIDELTTAAPAVSSDEIPIWRSGDTFKLALSDLSGVVGAGDVLNTVASSGASQTINYATADVWDITLTANCVFTLAGFTNAKADYLTLVLRQDGTGSRAVTWPAITWIGSGIAPVLQTAPSSVDSVVLFSFNGGTNVYGIAQTSASGLKSGTSFPGSPTDGDLFYRTDRRILYEYDTTPTRWLSLDRKYVSIPDGLIGTTTLGTTGMVPIFEDVYVERWLATTFASINNGSNFYTYTLTAEKPSTAGTTVSSFATSADAASNYILHNVSVATVYAAATYSAFEIDVTKTGTPNARFCGASLVIRSVG